MDKRIILATAGAGKTYHIANHFQEDERVLLISYTRANVANIKKEVKDRYNGIIPSNITFSTFDAFVYNFLLRPLEPLLSFENIISQGVDLFSKPSIDPRQRHIYHKIDNIKHFMNQNNEYFVNRMSKLFFRQSTKYKKIALNRISSYFDSIYFDEFQDFNGNDFKTIKYIIENSSINVYAVGDIFQSNVTPIKSDGRGSGIPFNRVNDQEDLENVFSHKITFDNTTLLKSRRVSSTVCEFIRKHLSIQIQAHNNKQSSIKFLTELDDIDKVLINESIPKLIWNSKARHNRGINYVNWSYSKGDTYDEACVILTEKASDLEQWSSLAISTRNKLYVALTRSKGDLYLIKSDSYKKWKNNHI